eukprot:1140057-Pelagomonas_calceolata.AAC.3
MTWMCVLQEMVLACTQSGVFEGEVKWLVPDGERTTAAAAILVLDPRRAEPLIDKNHLQKCQANLNPYVSYCSAHQAGQPGMPCVPHSSIQTTHP